MNDFEDENKDKNSKGIILSVIAILVLIVAVVGVTYAAFTFTGTGVKENTISSGTITFNYQEDTNGISLVNAQPITDTAGKVLAESDAINGVQRGYFDFTVSSTVTGNANINYEVYATNESPAIDKLDEQYVKVYLTDVTGVETAFSGYTGTVPTYDSLTTATSNAIGKRLYQGTFANTGNKKFRLRIWVSNNYTVTNVSKTFIMKVNVKATN